MMRTYFIEVLMCMLLCLLQDQGSTGMFPRSRPPWGTLLIWSAFACLASGRRAASAASNTNLFRGVPHVIVVDLAEPAWGKRRSQQAAILEGKLKAVGVPYDHIRALSPQGLEASHRTDGSVVYSTGNLTILAWDTISELLPLRPVFNDDGPREVGRLHAHLRALQSAVALGLEWVVVMESLIAPETLSTDGNVGKGSRCGVGVTDLVKALPQETWKVLQLSFEKTSVTTELALLDAYREGTVVRPRDARTSDVMLHGTGAYAIHRRGMIELLGKYWPDDAPDTLELTNELRAGKVSRRSLWEQAPYGTFDLRLRTCVATSESVVYSMRHAYVSTCPLWRSTGLDAGPPPEHWGMMDELYREVEVEGRRLDPMRLSEHWVDPSSPLDVQWVLLGKALLKLPSPGAPRDEVEAALAGHFKYYCSLSIGADESQLPCRNRLYTLGRQYLHLTDPVPPVPNPALPRVACLIILTDSRLTHASWPLPLYNGSLGAPTMQDFADRMLDGDASPSIGLWDTWSTLGRHIDRLTNVYDYLGRARPLASPNSTAAALAPATYPYPIAGFYHVAAAGRYWHQIFQHQLQTIEGCGLLDVMDSLTVLMLGTGSVPRPTHPKIQIVDGGADILQYEFPTIQRLADYCEANPTARVFYIHNKGSMHQQPQSSLFLNVHAWRMYMEHFVLVRHRECLAALDQGGFDTCGVDMRAEPVRHYSGNFYWAKCSYINTLQRVETLDWAKRHEAEFWIGRSSKADTWRPKMCFNSTLNLYVSTMLPEYYEGAPGCGEEMGRDYWEVNRVRSKR